MNNAQLKAAKGKADQWSRSLKNMSDIKLAERDVESAKNFAACYAIANMISDILKAAIDAGDQTKDLSP